MWVGDEYSLEQINACDAREFSRMLKVMPESMFFFTVVCCGFRRRQREEEEVKDPVVARKVQKADREKLRRDRLNEHFLELGSTLGI